MYINSINLSFTLKKNFTFNLQFSRNFSSDTFHCKHLQTCSNDFYNTLLSPILYRSTYSLANEEIDLDEVAEHGRPHFPDEPDLLPPACSGFLESGILTVQPRLPSVGAFLGLPHRGNSRKFAHHVLRSRYTVGQKYRDT